MKLRFVKCNPTENMTVLVMDPVPAAMRPAIARTLMAENHLHAEQVGFFDDQGEHMQLHMMGGEFCANATRSLAAVLALNKIQGEKIESGGSIYQLHVSGVDEPVTCEVFQEDQEGVFRSELILPLPLSIGKRDFLYHGRVISGVWVTFPGITHLVVNSSDVGDKCSFFRAVKTQMMDSIPDAFGIMYYDETHSYMEALVWVKKTETLVWERGCGSGSAAVGAALALMGGSEIHQEISQPGGSVMIDVGWQSGITFIRLSGSVRIVAEGTAFVTVE